jgi:putative addiction module component (TIGR02574 family)
MITVDSQIFAQIEALSAAEKLLIVDWILSNLDQPDPEIDKLWSIEAENRLDAYEKGQIKAVDLETVLQKYRK